MHVSGAPLADIRASESRVDKQSRLADSELPQVVRGFLSGLRAHRTKVILYGLLYLSLGLPLICLLLGLHDGVSPHEFAPPLLIAVLLNALLFLIVLRYPRRVRSDILWSLIGFTCLYYAMLSLLFRLADSFLTPLFLPMIAAVLLSLPLGKAASLSLMIALLALCISGIVIAVEVRWLYLIFLPMCVLMWRVRIASHLGTIGSYARKQIAAICQAGSVGGVDLLRVLAALGVEIFEAKRVLIGFSGGDSEILTARGLVRANSDPLFVRGLLQNVSDTKAEDGELDVSAMGEQFFDPVREWFGYLPRRLLFFRLVVVRDNREEDSVIVFPRPYFEIFHRIRRAHAMFVDFLAVGRIFLAATRSRFLTSDLLLISQQSASWQEEEMSQLIHLVNNAAQDVALGCEELRQVLPAANGDGKIKGALSHLRLIESAARGLSAAVSDVRRIRELRRLRKFPRSETVQLSSVLDDIELFGAYGLKRRGGELHIIRDLPADMQVRVISREFFEATLREAVRVITSDQITAERHGNQQAKVTVSCNDVSVVFKFACEMNSEMFKERLAECRKQENFVQDSGSLAAISNFVELSQGNLKVETDGDHSLLVIDLPRAVEEVGVALRAGDWVLFVDDNLQVLTFYGRLAEALGLRFKSCTTLSEARQCLNDLGQPLAVFTDLQIGDESGIGLIRELRANKPRELPIVVVSGMVEEQVREQVMLAGATKFLSKPVGRARIVAELQSFAGVFRGGARS